MKYEDYETSLNSVITNPDTAPAVIQEILAELKADLTALDSATVGLSERDARIKDLQDTNIKLFTSMTGTESVEDEVEDWAEMEGDEAIEAFIEAHKEEE